MKSIKLSREERAIEEALVKGEYVDVDKTMFKEIAEAITRRQKDAVLNIRVNSHDLAQIKSKTKRLGIRYQTFIAELLHRVATESQ